MTFHERTQAVARMGFTDRQARFLVTVMLHSGVCVPPQYARFARIAYGQKTQKFFAKLVRLGYLTLPFDVIVVVNRTERPSRICFQITRKVPSGSEVIPK